MIQLIGLLLCAYLIFKGAEILMVAAASARDDRRTLIIWGVVCLVAAIAIAGSFALLFLASGVSMSDLPSR